SAAPCTPIRCCSPPRASATCCHATSTCTSSAGRTGCSPTTCPSCSDASGESARPWWTSATRWRGARTSALRSWTAISRSSGIGSAAPTGTPVRAVAAGTVSLAGPLGTYLTSVLIDHGGGYYTFYGYLSDAAVAPGERVLKGQLVGHVGGGSSDQGPHLHFEIRGRGGIALDPVNWLKSRR